MKTAAIAVSAAVAIWPACALAQEPPKADPTEEEPMPPPGYVPGHARFDEHIGLGLSPYAPGQQTVLPGGIAPTFGAPLMPQTGGKFDFKGHLQLGARTGIGKRKEPGTGQSSTTFHGDPIVPRGNVFENTNVVPYVWSALEFSYSLPSVTATVSLGAWNFSESMQASGAFNPGAQLWVNDAFLSYKPANLGPIKLAVRVGVFPERYGNLEQYSSGPFTGPLIATIHGVGENIAAELPVGESVRLFVEHGIKTDMDRPPADVPTGPANNWPKPWEGQTFVNHLHVGAELWGVLRPGLHYISAFARDDRGDATNLGNLRAGYADYDGGPPELRPELDHADGSLRVLGADLQANFRDFGYLGVAVAHTQVEHVRTVNSVVEVLGAGGGRDLMDRYFGRNNDFGRGELLVAGAEYAVSLGTLLRRPEEFWGDGPDLKLSLFGMYAQIKADDPARDGEQKYKLGLEATYSALSWLALAGRADRVVPYMSAPKVPLYIRQNDNSYSVLTARAVLRSDWQAREALTLQYSHFIYRENFHVVTLNSGGQVSTVSDEPDRHLLALYGTLWW
jgi:hypothetical protein